MNCQTCKVPMTSLGQVPVRVGGSSGGWNILLGALAEAGEDVWPLDVYRCSSCRRVELFDMDLSLPES